MDDTFLGQTVGIDEKFGDRLATSIGNLAPVVKIFSTTISKVCNNFPATKFKIP